ncbi:MAG: hypothetical protein COB04_10505 [Gammaproteobacteria bacterium]|nr:MAG: hypothetical protein COB04_10505 [Gammaproteobacteria bacterium]
MRLRGNALFLHSARYKTESMRASLERAEHLAEQRLQLLIQAEKLSALGMLSAGVAHEIKSPIAFVASNLEVLDEYLQLYRALVAMLPRLFVCANETQSRQVIDQLEALWQGEDFDYINRDAVSLVGDAQIGAGKVNDLVRNLNAYMAVSDVHSALFCDLNEEIKSTLKLIRHELKYKIDLHQDLNALPKACIFEGEIHQVLINILMNSVHSIEGKGNIWISTRLENAHQVIRIKDDGHGIEASDLEAIFDPFFTTKDKQQGTGLGLSLSRDIINAHNGEIVVDSLPGQGCQFSIRLPVSNTVDSVRSVEKRVR